MTFRTLSCSALLLGLALAAATPARAISVVEPIAFGSWRAQPEVWSIGGGAAVGMLSFDLVPSAEYVFIDHGSSWALNVDAHIPVLPLPVVAFYVGGGFTSISSKPDGGDTTWRSGGNLLIGAKASIRRMKPFAEIKYSTAGADGYVFTIGTRFHLRD
jgi:hypothetical protein